MTCSSMCPPQRGLMAHLICPTIWLSLRSKGICRRWPVATPRLRDVPSFLGAGAYRHHIPASVDHLTQRGEFLTSYTPYQPEISQGTLQALFEFQSMVALITGMDVANASMYDGATSCAEAVLMARRVTRRNRALVSGSVHPHYSAASETSGQICGYQD